MANIQSHEAILLNSIISTAVQDELKQELKRLGYTDLAPSHFMLCYTLCTKMGDAYKSNVFVMKCSNKNQPLLK